VLIDVTFDDIIVTRDELSGFRIKIRTYFKTIDLIKTYAFLKRIYIFKFFTIQSRYTVLIIIDVMF